VAQLRHNSSVISFRNGVFDERKIAAGVEKARKALARDVVRIRFNVGEDWTGDPALFFRVVFTDKASKPGQLGELAIRVSEKITSETKVDQTGLFPYFSFRSQSETLQLREAEWD
jgi:hypothetical protein